MSVDAYRAHVLEQIQNNVAFLVEQNHLSRSNADAIMSLLTEDTATNTNYSPRPVPPLPVRRATALGRIISPGAYALPSLTREPSSTIPDVPASPRRAVPPVPTLPARAMPVPAVTVEDMNVVQARTLWAYNQNNEDPDDLTFDQGDIIEIVSETNPDWWTGRFQGREGLFPSNYVQKLSQSNINSSQAAPAYTSQNASDTFANEKTPIVGPARRAYKPFGATYHGTDTPPPSGSGGVNSVGLQEAPGQDQKKSKFGKYGNTMAHSAAGGVGFGAGAAIGGGLVRAIF